MMGPTPGFLVLEPEHGSADLVEDADGILEGVDFGARPGASCLSDDSQAGVDWIDSASDAVVGVDSSVVFAGEDALLVVEVVVSVAAAEGLAAAVGIAIQGSAVAGGEDGSCGPSPKNATEESVLPFVEGFGPDHVGVVDEFAVERLHAVHRVEVEWIVGSVLAGGLDEGASAEGFGVGEVVVHGETVPIRHSEGGKAGVVVAVSDGAVEGDTG